MTTGGRLHYHRPSDDLETLDCGGIARIAAMAADWSSNWPKRKNGRSIKTAAGAARSSAT
jgi:hypothetical protein